VASPPAPDVLDALDPSGRRRAAVLARPSLNRVVEVLRGAEGPLSAAEIAETLGRHHTGVRTHLAALEDAGVVESLPGAPAGRGRPSRLYRLGPDAAEREAAGHRELVRLLMALVRSSGFGAEHIERFGEQQGASFVEPGGGVTAVHEAFARLGFAPVRRRDGDAEELVLGRCPFADGVEAPGGELICVLHRGLARGAARRTAPAVGAVELEVRNPRRAGCRLRLSPAPGA
jgi:predicted ArsR family transcriptional regulator